MVAEYTRYLGEHVLNERQVVTHRSLSRALKVHCHLAKRMLYDFHRTENAKRPGSVHATYVITGVQKASEKQPATNGTPAKDGRDGADDIMQSSPYLSSSMPQQDSLHESVETVSIILAREEDLAAAKETFQSIASIYVYSLQPTVLQDLNVLTDVGREMSVTYAGEDPLEMGPRCGMIQNRNVKRRTGARPPAPPPPAAQPRSSTTSTIPPKRSMQQDLPKPETKIEDDTASRQPSQSEMSSRQPGKAAEKAAGLKREKSNLFTSFAKAKPKLKKEESASAPAASGAESAEPSGPEDVMLDDASEDEPDELFPETEKRPSSTSRETKREREERLRKMMEDDEDEEMPDATETPEEPEPPTIDQPIKEPELKEQATVHAGRRRGRRQVMKKRTVKDEEGYLVTIEEPAWESFSEDEVAAPPPKKKPAVSASKGKAGGKPGQGNIMSFFSKK